MGIKGFLKAFKDAGRGFADALIGGRNMKIHLMAAGWALLVVWTSGYGKWYYIAVIAASALVLAAECLNSAVEKLCDRVTRERDPLIRSAKDMAAGAVLICALAALGIALFLFVDLDFWKAVLASVGDGRGWAAIAIVVLPLAAAVLAFTKPKSGESAPKNDKADEVETNGDN